MLSTCSTACYGYFIKIFLLVPEKKTNFVGYLIIYYHVNSFLDMYRNIFRTLFIRTLICVLLFCFCSPLQADDWINTQYNTTEGNEFWLTFLRNAGKGKEDSDLYLRLFASAREETEVTVYFNPDSLANSWAPRKSITFTIPAGKDAGLPDSLAIPNIAAYVEDDEDKYKGVYVTSSSPISLYALNCFSNSYDATIVYPLSALQQEYVIQTYGEDHSATEFAIVAPYDGTEVTLYIHETDRRGKVKKSIKNINLDRGNTYLYRSQERNIDLTGTHLCANKPVAVFQGGQDAFVPKGDRNGPANHLYEQSIPTSHWGKKFIVSRSGEQDKDVMRLTAAVNNTEVYLNGMRVRTLGEFETYELEIEWSRYRENAICIETSNACCCGLYLTSYYVNRNTDKGAPTLTAITPLEYGLNSTITSNFAFENDEGEDLNINDNAEHYINIVVENSKAKSMVLDGNNIGSKFQTLSTLIDGEKYAVARIKVSMGAHLIKNEDIDAKFVAHVYGILEYQGEYSSRSESYAYSAGSRVNRSVDMLIDNEYIREKKICINNSVDFTSIVGFDYERLEWEIEDDTLFYSTDSIINDYVFSKADTNEVRLYVYSRTPVCDNELVDTVIARIIVDTLNRESKYYEKCYGGKFDFTYKGTNYVLEADTTTEHSLNGNLFTFQINTPIVFQEIIQQSNTCDIRRTHTLVLRPTFKHELDTIACEEFVWTDPIFHDKGKVDTIHTFKVESNDILPITKEYTHSFTSRYGCDSTVTMRVTLNKSYEKDTTVVICQNSFGETFNWLEHTGIDDRYLHKYDTLGNYQKVQEISLNTPGKYTYIDSLVTKQAPYCDSIFILHLTIYPRYEYTILDTICQNTTFEWDVNNVRYVGGSFLSPNANDVILPKADSLYTFTENLQTEQGCDSIYHLQLLVLPVYDTIVVANICDNAEYSFNDTIYRGEKLDSINGLKAQSLPYEYTHILSTENGCDSVVTLQLYVHPTYLTEDTVLMCQGKNGVYNWEREGVAPPFWCKELGQRVDEIKLEQLGSFTYIDSTSTELGCDNIHILYLTVGGFVVEEEPQYLCDNDTLVWHNRLYVGHNFNESYDPTAYEYVKELPDSSEQYVFNDSILETSIQGCDSAHFLTLYISPSYVTPVRIDTISLCDNESYMFYDSVYNQHGEWVSDDNVLDQYRLTYTDTTIHGCDSVVMHVVNVHPTYEYVTYDTICQQHGGIYDWINHTHPLYCEEFNGMVANISTSNAGEFTYIDSLKSTTCRECPRGACDSVYILHLNVMPTYDIIDTIVVISEDDVFTWKENAITYGGYNTNLPCDTIIALQYPDTFVVTKKYETKPIGTYVCDSLRTLKLIIGKVTRDTIYDVACSNQPYLWYGKDQFGNDSLRWKIDNPKDSIYLDAYKTTLGFDSIFCLNLKVLPAYDGIDSMTTRFNTCQYSHYKWTRNGDACSDRLFCTNTNQWVSIVDTIPTNEVGTFIYVDSLKTQDGCDSVWILQLTIESLFRDTISVNMCENDYFVWEYTVYKGAKCTDLPLNDTLPIVTLLPQLNYFVDTTYVTSDGCDSTKCLNLNVYPIYASVDTAVIGDNNSPYIWATCDSYGAYYDTIHFTQKPMYFDPITQVYKKDTMVITDRNHTLTSVNGCDSVANLHLVINPTYLFLTEDTICSGDYYVWRGYSKHWTGGGLIVVKDSFQTAAGCDSIYQLNLYLKPNSVTHRYREVCYNDTVYHEDFLVWGPGMSTEDNIKDVLYVNVEGCDSIIRYHITLHPTYNIGTDSVYTICANETFELHKSYIYTPELKYYEPGEIAPIVEVSISDTLQTTTCPKCPDKACDSIYSAHLRILPVYKHVDFDTICSVDTVVWRGINCFQPQAGNYTYYDSLLTSSGCDSIYELHLRVKQSYNIALPPDTICADDSIFFAGRYVNQSGIYLDTMSTIDQCDSIIYLELTVLDTTSLTIYDTICVTEKYLLDTLYSNRRIFTESGFYVDTALNEWGCKHYTYLYLEVIDTTKYTLEIGNICADDEEISIYYTYTGRHLIEYSILFDSLGIAQGFEDIYHAPLDSKQSSIHIPIPQGPALPHPEPTYFDSKQGVNAFVYDDKYTYPQPNKYRITVIMHNGICGDTLQRKDTSFQIMYPSWIHEQHWNDGIILYNDTYNGGYEFSSYQWYQNGEPLVGETKEYLYLPSGLLLNNRGDCNNYYQVQLTREKDGYSTLTCPICPIYLTNDTIVPRLDYFSIVPTLVVKENPVVHILSTMRGTCIGYDMAGNQLFEPFDFVPDGNNYAGAIVLPVSQSGMINIRLTTQDGDTRMFKVLVK